MIERYRDREAFGRVVAEERDDSTCVERAN